MAEFVLTRKGKEEMEAQLEYLKTVKRAEISEQIKIARSFGDLSENAEYTEARNEQSRLEGKILGFEKTLRLAVVVEDDEINVEKVGVGTMVRVQEVGSEEEETYKILGSMESDVENNCISNESPVGMALMGRHVGDVVDVSVPAGVIRFVVREISRADI